MSFPEQKFRELPLRNQAKKLADLLGAALLTEERPVEAHPALIEYYRLLTLVAPEAIEITTRTDRRAIYGAYLHWRRAAGFGPETRVYRHLAREADGLPEAPAADPGGSIDYAVWLHDIRSGYNVGAVLRTAECFGFRAAYLSGYTPGPEQAAVRAAAMGCETWLSCQRFPGATDVCAMLSAVVAGPIVSPADPSIGSATDSASAVAPRMLIALESPNTPLPRNARAAAATDLRDFTWPAAAILILGNEELGIDPELLGRADAVVHIPLFGRKTSLNLASAFAIAACAARCARDRQSTGDDVGRYLPDDDRT